MVIQFRVILSGTNQPLTLTELRGTTGKTHASISVESDVSEGSTMRAKVGSHFHI